MKTKTLADFQICISVLLTELKQQLKIEVAEALKNELKKGKSYSQQFRYFNNILRFVRSKQQEANEEFEQYGRRLCARIHGVSTIDNETSDEVFDTVKSLVKEISSDIPDVVIMDRAHQIGKGYNNKQQMYVVNVLQLLGTERCFI